MIDKHKAAPSPGRVRWSHTHLEGPHALSGLVAHKARPHVAAVAPQLAAERLDDCRVALLRVLLVHACEHHPAGAVEARAHRGLLVVGVLLATIYRHHACVCGCTYTVQIFGGGGGTWFMAREWWLKKK